jgi:hypothetical protein
MHAGASCACSSAGTLVLSVRQNAAFEKSLELVFDKLRQAHTVLRLDLSEERLEMFPHRQV